MPAQRFIGAILVLSVGLALLLASVNIALDPYVLFDVPRVSGFNDVKPSVETREMLMKAYQSRRSPAKTVILGSSRTDLALDPASDAWPMSLRPVYNLSIVGGGIDTGLRYLQNMTALRPAEQLPKHLVVGLDFEDFLIIPPRAAREAQQLRRDIVADDTWRKRLLLSRDGQHDIAYQAQTLADYLTATLSLDALCDSLSTLLASRSSTERPNLESNGHMSEARFMSWTQADGAATLFWQKHVATIRKFASPVRVLGDLSDGPDPELKSVRKLMDFARSSNMSVHLLVMPSHPTHLEIFDHLGYWDEYELWKRALAQTVASAVASGTAARLLDFGGFDEPVREKVQGSADDGRMRWFWDSVHPTKALGDVMLQRAFAAEAVGTDFGAPLSPATIEARLEAVRADRDSYRLAHVDDLARTLEVLCAARDCRVKRSGIRPVSSISATAAR